MNANDFALIYACCGIAYALERIFTFLALSNGWDRLTTERSRQSFKILRGRIADMQDELPGWACALVMTIVTAIYIAMLSSLALVWPIMMVRRAIRSAT
jgi:hypothetical protein